MRGVIIWAIWIALAAALAAPQRALGQAAPSLIGDVSPERTNTPLDPVILEPLRPLLPRGNEDIALLRDCGSSEVLMMSTGALFFLMFNLTGNVPRAQREK